MTFGDAITTAIRGHTGLHYVPSFNDFVSSANDDMERIELDRESGRDQFPAQGPAAPAGAKGLPSNKADDLPGLTSVLGMDLHKVNRANVGPGTGRVDWVYDNARGGSRAPTVWQYIVASKGEGEPLPTFEQMAQNRQNTIGAGELQKHFNVSPAQAHAMVAEADRDNDNRISKQEFLDIIETINEVSA
ncbi:hypothetical protein HYH03_000520 [Edaphochlamys debaryana]|uniref:EF-hand domain-containing protein n=1 Tax=Edaphochlamys debaryana TaxID=47281 RepID=A0A835YJD0_9CHLO|nr:hypothetical protein HYH03_000520 [Edaphochlamys debaryana]|eukprot:KAG2502026.1 hypothetical protein HYH03_000520 [Edaphochlamys debaryana]